MSPKVRQTIYYLGTIVPALLGIGLIWGGIDQGAADSIGDIIAGLVSLLGAGAPAVAAKKVNEQRKDGTLDQVSPADQVINGVQAVIEAKNNIDSDVQRVKDVVTGVLNQVPVLGPLGTQVLNSIHLP